MAGVPSDKVSSALASVVAPEALDFRATDMLLGARWARAYAVSAFPPRVGAGWLAAAANLPGVTLAMHALPTDPGALVMSLDRAVSRLAGAMESHTTALAAQRAEAQWRDAQELMRQIDQEQQSVWTIGVLCLVQADDESTGIRRAKRLEGMLAAAGLRARPLVFLQEPGLLGCGPWALFPPEVRGGTPTQVPAGTVAAALPFAGSGINHGRGVVLGHDSGGGLVLWDRWSPPDDSGISNPHLTVLAASGAGKSHAAKLLAVREWVQGARVIVVDPEREYRGMCRAVGGAWINAGGAGGRINPLQAPPLAALPEDADADGAAGSAVAQHAQRVGLVLDLALPGLDDTRRAMLQRAIRAVYSEAGIDASTDPGSVAPDRWPHMGHLHAWCLAQDGADWQSLAMLLEDAAVGATADLWAGPTVADAGDAEMVVIDIHDLADARPSVRRAQYQNVLGWAWDLIRRDRAERKILLVDEAWLLVDPQVPEALGFLRSMAKRARKYNCGVQVVTQNPIDFLAVAVAREGEPVLANASTKLLLRQEGRDLPTVAGLFGLSDAEQDRLRSARVGEGLLIAGNNRAWVVIDTAPHETALLYGG